MLFQSPQLSWRTAFVGALAATLSWLPIVAGAAAPKTQADYFVRSLPGAPQPLLKMHAGYV
jgi:carboxypeptidase D